MISLHKQKGVALFIAMLILPLLLVLGVLLLSSSFLGLKIIDTRAMQEESNIILDGVAQEILQQSDSAQVFAGASSSSSFSSALFTDVSTALEFQGELSCKRRMQASGGNFKCRYSQLNLNHAYGRDTGAGTKRAVNSLGLGVEQPILVE